MPVLALNPYDKALSIAGTRRAFIRADSGNGSIIRGWNAEWPFVVELVEP
jgi:hypothetical protein